MKNRHAIRLLTWTMILALFVPSLAEELGEMDLYDPAIYIGDIGGAPEAPAGEALMEALPLVPGACGDDDIAPGESPVPELEDAVLPAPEDGSVEKGEEELPLEEAIAEPSDAAEVELGVGESRALNGAALLSGGEVDAYASSDESIVRIDRSTGVMLGCAVGTAQVYVRSTTGDVAGCTVTVLKAPESLSLPFSSLKLGKAEQFRLEPSVGEGERAAFLFASSNRKVAAVSAEGVITAKKTGKAKIGISTYDKQHRLVIEVNVKAAPSKLKLSPAKAVLNAGQTLRLKGKLNSGSASHLTWKSNAPEVASVDADGVVTAGQAGVAVIAAKTYNGKKAKCAVLVLAGSAPTTLTLGVESVKLGKKEKLALAPQLGEGEEAVYAYSTSNKKIATVSAEGVIQAKATGTAKITVMTHNGLSAVLKVKVCKAPAGITLSKKKLSMKVGATKQLTYSLPKGSASLVKWKSSDKSVATVDADGNVTAVAKGTAVITATTFNKKKATCKVQVSGTSTSQARMLENLRADNTLGLGGKKDAIIGVVELLMQNGFEPAFAAGVASNVYSEGTYGLFESSKYTSNPKRRPRYFAYLDGGKYYKQTDGKYKLTAIYLSPEEYETYSGKATKYLRFGEENYYLNNFSKKYAQDVDLNELESFLAKLSEGGWQGKFGLGVVQWTGGRTAKLVEYYRKHAGSGSSITKAQVIAAENEMILYELQGSYNRVYTAWKQDNTGGLSTLDAARSAGALVCTKYEIPANKDAKAVTRGSKAAAIFKVMLGQ